MMGYYLGERMIIQVKLGGTGWVLAYFDSDRKRKLWRMWRRQILKTPWGK